MMMIEPYEAIGPLHFGMDQNDVVAAMGEPQRITKSRRRNILLWYGDVNVTMEADKLVEVGFGPAAPVSIHGIHPFTDQGAFDSLCRLDGNPCKVLGFIVFRNLGITLTGFHDKDESQKALTAFARGRWDVLEPQMKPYSLQATGPASRS